MKTFVYSVIAFILIFPWLNYVGYSLHTKSNKYGECIGIFEPEDVNLKYAISKRNMLLTVLFLPSILTPSVIVAVDLYCPIGKK